MIILLKGKVSKVDRFCIYTHIISFPFYVFGNFTFMKTKFPQKGMSINIAPELDAEKLLNKSCWNEKRRKKQWSFY